MVIQRAIIVKGSYSQLKKFVTIAKESGYFTDDADYKQWTHIVVLPKKAHLQLDLPSKYSNTLVPDLNLVTTKTREHGCKIYNLDHQEQYVKAVSHLTNFSIHAYRKETKKFSSRELEVLNLIASGKKNLGISKELGVNEKTVSTYVMRLKKKLGVSSNANAFILIKEAVKQGVLTSEIFEM